jgi:hypothetical protein
MFNEENQIHNLISSSGSGTAINYGSGSDFLTSYGSGYGSGSTSQKVTVPTVAVPVPVPQHCRYGEPPWLCRDPPKQCSRSESGGSVKISPPGSGPGSLILSNIQRISGKKV